MKPVKRIAEGAGAFCGVPLVVMRESSAFPFFYPSVGVRLAQVGGFEEGGKLPHLATSGLQRPKAPSSAFPIDGTCGDSLTNPTKPQLVGHTSPSNCAPVPAPTFLLTWMGNEICRLTPASRGGKRP